LEARAWENMIDLSKVNSHPLKTTF
jgi:hypothetical protein